MTIAGKLLVTIQTSGHIYIYTTSRPYFDNLLSSSKAPVRVTVSNPEWDTKKWSEYANLVYIELMFRRIGDVTWHSALTPAGARIYISKNVPEVCCIIITIKLQQNYDNHGKHHNNMAFIIMIIIKNYEDDDDDN
jgi:hypothetical protein